MTETRGLGVALILSTLALFSCATQRNVLGDSPEAKKFAPLAALVGDWEGVGVGSNGQSVGSFTLAPDLGTHVLVRRSFNSSPQGLHEDMTIIYPEADGFRADYWDNEGHVIRYRVYPQPENKAVVFESSPGADGSQFRLTYRFTGDDTIELRFDVGRVAFDFKNYLTGTLQRRKK